MQSGDDTAQAAPTGRLTPTAPPDIVAASPGPLVPVQPGAITKADPQTAALMEMTPAQHEELYRKVEAAIVMRRRLVRLSLKLTDSGDWDDIGGKPYLRGTGAQKMLLVGLTLHTPNIVMDWDEGDLFVRVDIVCEWPAAGLRLSALGFRNTLDPFFAKEGREGTAYAKAMEQAGHNERVAKRMIEGHIVKSAVEQATSRVVRGVLGLRNIEWADLEEMGLKRGAGGTVEFDGKDGDRAAAKKTKPAATSGGKSKAPASPPIDCQIHELPRFAPGAVVSFTGVVKSWNKISDKVTRVTVADGRGVSEKAISVFTVQVRLPDWVAAGVVVRFQGVKVETYQNAPSYACGAANLTIIDGPAPAPPPVDTPGDS